MAWFEKDETFLGTLSESHRMRVLGFSEDTVSFLRAVSLLSGRHSLLLCLMLSDTERVETFPAGHARKHLPGDLSFSKHIRGSAFSLLSTFYILMRGNLCDIGLLMSSVAGALCRAL